MDSEKGFLMEILSPKQASLISEIFQRQQILKYTVNATVQLPLQMTTLLSLDQQNIS